MALETPKKTQTRRNRRVFGIILALVVFLVPFTGYIVQNFVSQDQVVQVDRGAVDASNKHNLGKVAKYIHGDVEFYYNQWLYSEPALEAPEETVYLPTPGYWTGKGEGYASTGYASYRYFIHGLTPGETIHVYPVIEIPNRVYLNGTLCSEIGYPSKAFQSTFVDLSHEVASPYVVPASGIVEYVMEVGNTGDGGAKKIGTIYFEESLITGISTLPFALISLGAIIGVLIFTVLGVWLSLKRVVMGALGMLAGGSLLFLVFSIDSPFVGAGLFYGGKVFTMLMILSFVIMILSVLLYERLTRKKVLFFPERIITLFLLAISTIACFATLGSDAAVYCFMVLGSVPIYLLFRHLVHFTRGSGGAKPSVLYASLGSIAMILSFALSNHTFVSYSAYPAALSLITCLVALASAFHEIYFDSLRQKDEAILTRRYHQVSSRALSRASNASDAIATLDYIEEGYGKSLRIGDKRLLTYSRITRRRLLALREDAIRFEEECELEGQLFDLRQAVQGGYGALVLDVEESEKKVPPLLFEALIEDLSKQLREGEILILGETRNSVLLSFPKRMKVNPKVMRALQERISLVSLYAKHTPGRIEIRRRERQ